MKKRIVGSMLLVAGAVTALGAAAIPAHPVAQQGIQPAQDPVSGIVRQAEAYANPDPTAEAGFRDVIHSCMAAAGIDYSPTPLLPIMDLNGAMGFPRLDVASAKATGYASLTPAGHESTTPEPEALNGPATSAVTTTGGGAGTSVGGCRAEAVTKIYGNVNDYARATVRAYNSVLVTSFSAASDPGVQKVVDDWRACMAKTPYSTFERPQQAFEAGTKAGGQEEIKIAVTDAVCRDKTGLQAHLDSLLDKYVTTWMRQSEQQIAEVTNLRAAAAARATALKAGQGK